jgi:hypothetical protein
MLIDINCAAPAITIADINVASKLVSPALTANSPKEIPTGITPRQAGIDALIPEKNLLFKSTPIFFWIPNYKTGTKRRLQSCNSYIE